MPEPKPSELRLVGAGFAERSDTFLALMLETPTGRRRRVDIPEGLALELASVILKIAATAARERLAGQVSRPATPGACRDCGEPFVPVRRGECSRCGSDAGPVPSPGEATS